MSSFETEATTGTATTLATVESSDLSVAATGSSDVVMAEQADTDVIVEAAQTEMVKFTVTFAKNSYEITFDIDAPVLRLKERLQGLSSVPTNMQKLMFKGLLKDDQASLRQSGIKNGVKLMLVGSTVSEVVAAKAAPAFAASSNSLGFLSEIGSFGSLSDMTEHKKVLDKGRPEDGEIGYRNKRASVPSGFSLRGLLNKSGNKVRLTFKHDIEQLWIATNERTDKVPYSSIRSVNTEPIKGNEDYHIASFQLGTTEKSRYFVYFVPAQYTQAIKDVILHGGYFF